MAFAGAAGSSASAKIVGHVVNYARAVKRSDARIGGNRVYTIAGISIA